MSAREHDQQADGEGTSERNEGEQDGVPINLQCPDMTRRVPLDVEIVAPLRFSNRSYKNDGGRIMISGDEPDLDSNHASSDDMYTMRVQIPVVGHAAVINKNLSVCEAEYASLSVFQMMAIPLHKPLSSLRWVIGEDPASVRPTTEMSRDMERTAECYAKRGPLMAYSNVAVLEAANHTSDSGFWRQLYSPLETVTRHYGWRGVVFDCMVLSMGASAGEDDSANLEAREPADNHDGILDVCYTPQTKAGGRVRALAFGTHQRIETHRTREIVAEMFSSMSRHASMLVGDWVLRWYGYTCRVTERCVRALVEVWKATCEPNMPTVHVFLSSKVVVVSSSTGVLIRPVRTSASGGRFEFQGPYVDTMTLYDCDTMAFAGVEFPDRTKEPEQYCCFPLLVEPFFRWSTEPRENLGIQMAIQGLGLHPVKGDATIVSLGETKPLVVTEHMDALMRYSTPSHRITTPGKNAVIAFINRTRNTEDAVSVMKEWAQSGAFAWFGYISFPLPKDCGVVKPGLMLDKQPWWVPATQGVVVSVTTSKSGDAIANVCMLVKELLVGDKLMLGHGIKFTVGELIPYKDMPRVVDDATGEVVVPNVLVNTKNLTRGIGGLVREMVACTSRFDSISSFRKMDKPKGKYAYSVAEEKDVGTRLPSGRVEMYGKELKFADSGGRERVVRCNYGIARITQIRHMAVLKQHFAREGPSGPKMHSGKMRGGTPRLGETEILSMLMQNLVLNTSDAVATDGLCDVTKCSVCCALPIFCDCANPKPPTTTCQVRYSMTELNVFATIAMLNTPDKPAYTLRFMTST